MTAYVNLLLICRHLERILRHAVCVAAAGPRPHRRPRRVTALLGDQVPSRELPSYCGLVTERKPVASGAPKHCKSTSVVAPYVAVPCSGTVCENAPRCHFRLEIGSHERAVDAGDLARRLNIRTV